MAKRINGLWESIVPSADQRGSCGHSAPVLFSVYAVYQPAKGHIGSTKIGTDYDNAKEAAWSKNDYYCLACAIDLMKAAYAEGRARKEAAHHG